MYSTMIRRRVKDRPAPVRNTIVLFDGGRRARVPDFGAGILAYRPASKLPCSIRDLAWATEAFASHSAMEVEAAEDRYDEILEQRYLESAMLDRYTRGYLNL
jgi:hypothetical protein